MRKIVFTVGVCTLALGLHAQSTNFSTNVSFRTLEQPLLTLPQFDAAGIGDALEQAIQLTSVTLSLTGNVMVGFSATNRASASKNVSSLRIEVIAFRAATTNAPGLGIDLIASNPDSFFSPDAAEPDLTLAPWASTNFPDWMAISADYIDSHLAPISSSVRSAYTGVDDIELLMSASMSCLVGAQDGVLVHSDEAFANMTATLTYTWEVIPEPGIWGSLAGALACVLAARRRRRNTRP